MTTMIRKSLPTAIAIAAIGYMHLIAPSAGQDGHGKVPEFDVRPTCESAADENLDLIDPPTVQSCMDEEQSALRTLEGSWSTFPAAARRDCAEAEQIGGYPSYVDLLGCLQDAESGSQLK